MKTFAFGAVASGALALAASVGLMACSVGYHLTLYRPVPNPKPRAANDVQLWTGDQKPTCPYDEIGMIQTDGQYGTEDNDILAGIRKKVGEAGCDGVVNLKKGDVGTIGQGLWQGTVYVCK